MQAPCDDQGSAQAGRDAASEAAAHGRRVCRRPPLRVHPARDPGRRGASRGGARPALSHGPHPFA
eukprot:2189039-Prymnesium_polylepis.2